jgi:pimeloyl-ACP methyl ester carboxylesterase
MHWRDYQQRQRVIELGDRFVSYVDEGNGDPIIMLHGIPTWGYLWEGMLPVLNRSHRVLIPDLLGFGYSDKSDRFDRAIDRQAEIIDKWMQALGLPNASIAGHDIGGGVALRLATLFPQRVRQLCVMNTVCYDSWPIEAMLQLGHPEAWRTMSAATVAALLRRALKRGCESTPPAAFLDGLLASYTTAVGKLSLIRNAAALNTNLTMEIIPWLSGIRVPTLILWGEEDTFQVAKYADRLALDIPGSRLIRIPHARHFVMVDQSEAVARHLDEWLTAPQARVPVSAMTPYRKEA